MGLISIGKNLLVIYICLSLLAIGIFGKEFTARLAVMTIITMLLSVYVLLEQTGIAPSHK